MKPAVVINYNEETGSVDLADNYMHYYAMARNGQKVNHMKIFCCLMDVCANIYNA
jgi:hypothetical protein